MSKTGNWKEAVEDFTVAASLDNTYGMAYFNRAISYQHLGNQKDACADLHTASKLGVKEADKIIPKICK